MYAECDGIPSMLLNISHARHKRSVCRRIVPPPPTSSESALEFVRSTAHMFVTSSVTQFARLYYEGVKMYKYVRQNRWKLSGAVVSRGAIKQAIKNEKAIKIRAGFHQCSAFGK